MCVYSWLEISVRPAVTTEWQLLLIFHILGPLLNRLTSEKPKLLLEVRQSHVTSHDMSHDHTPMQVVMEIYHLVVAVDSHQDGHFSRSNVLCDFLYPQT